MTKLNVSLIWLLVAVSAVYSAQAGYGSVQVLDFSDSEGTTIIIYQSN